MSCSDDQTTGNDALGTLDDAVAAAAFRRLVRLLQHRSDAAMDKEAGRAIVHGMPTAEWKARHHTAATPEQLARMEESMAKNP